MIAPPGARVLLLDVEGTTTDVSFVHDVLFPWARARLGEFLRARGAEPEVRAALDALEKERAREEEPAPSAAAYAAWLMDRDRKSTALKSLQGRIWEDGYRSGALRAHVYPDVRPALECWRARGRRVAIFSSGSVLAQRLLFAHTVEGDLTPLVDDYFDTTTGPKREAASYRRIADSLRVAPGAVLFASDVASELDAARAAGLWTALAVRGTDPPETGGHPVLRSFDELRP